jgi:hypothetical protein
MNTTCWFSRSVSRWALVLLAALGTSLASTATARAGNIQVTLLAILATDRNKKVDEKIRCIAEEVQRREPTWTGFREARTTCKSLPVGEEATFPLVDEKVATVRIDSGPDKDNWVSLTLKAPGLGEISYSVRCGRCVPIRTPYRTKSDERLIVAVMVKPCNKGK